MSENSYTDDDIKEALEYIDSEKLRVPLCNPTGVFLIDEGDFLMSDYTNKDKRSFYLIAIGLNEKKIDQSFIDRNNNYSSLRLKDDIKQLFQTVRKFK